jgi:tripartite-type tricarboxylate transporter receptor subunit TctC
MTGSGALRNARRVAVGVVLMSTAVLGLADAALAQSYPSKSVKIVVPFPAGGPLDFTARLLADRLATSMKQPFVVENRPGASGNIGTDAVAKAVHWLTRRLTG